MGQRKVDYILEFIEYVFLVFYRIFRVQ